VNHDYFFPGLYKKDSIFLEKYYVVPIGEPSQFIYIICRTIIDTSHQPKFGHGLKSGGPSRGWCLKQCGSILAVITSIVTEYGNMILRSIPDLTRVEKFGERTNLKRKEGRLWN